MCLDQISRYCLMIERQNFFIVKPRRLHRMSVHKEVLYRFARNVSCETAKQREIIAKIVKCD